MQTTKPITADAVLATDEGLVIVFADREVKIGWENCSPKLAAATAKQRRRADLSPGGYGIHWPLIDEDLSIGELLKQQ